MALSKEAIAALAKLAKLTPEQLTAAITAADEQNPVTETGLESFSGAELTTLKKNEYESGKVKGVEMAVKETKEKLNLDFQGKSIDNLIEAHKAAVLEEAKVSPNDQVKDLQTRLQTAQNTIKDYETKISEKDAAINTVTIETELSGYIPEFGEDSPALGKKDIINLMKVSGYESKLENGKVVLYKDGEPVKDKLGNNAPAKEIVTDFLRSKKLLTDETPVGGRGGSDKRPPAKWSTLSELKEHYVKQNKSLNGEEFQNAVDAAMTANKEFDLTK